jgi:hypothetical protein
LVGAANSERLDVAESSPPRREREHRCPYVHEPSKLLVGERTFKFAADAEVLASTAG